MRKSAISGLLSVLLFAPALWASKVEKEARKLDKELRKISLTAAVIDGRRVVNRVMAKQLSVGRKQLVQERRETGFVYGQIFGAHEVARLSSSTFYKVAEQMKQGHSLLDISEQHNVDLKAILADAKELNKKIDHELDRVSSGEEDELAEDSADSYDPGVDSLAADIADFTPAEIIQATNTVHARGAAFGQGGPFGSNAGGVGRGQSQAGGMSSGTGGGVSGGRGRH